MKLINNKQSNISRRLFLRGASGAVLASPVLLPSLSEAAAVVPKRCVTIFFGQGLPEQWYPTQQGQAAPVYSGVMSPFNQFSSRLAVVPVDHVAGGGDPHDVGPQSAFTGMYMRNNGAGGPTIDQVIKETLHPNGAPTPLQTVSMGTYHREGGLLRHVHSWNSNLRPAALPIEDPGKLFDRIFASGNTPGPSGNSLAQRLKRSVLDSVLDSYNYYKGDRSPLGVEQRNQLSDHLERLRELEKASFPEDGGECTAPAKPGNTGANSLRANERDGGGGGGTDIVTQEWAATWKALVNVYVAGLECDIFRFGNVTFQSGGDRIRLKGDYIENGQVIERFNDRETSHEYYHRWRGNGNALAKSHSRFTLGNIAFLLAALDKARDENGGSMLDSSSVIVTTELSDPSDHSYGRVFHALSSAGGAIKVGKKINANGAKNLDLYNTCLQGLGVNAQMGNSKNIINGVI